MTQHWNTIGTIHLVLMLVGSIGTYNLIGMPCQTEKESVIHPQQSQWLLLLWLVDSFLSTKSFSNDWVIMTLVSISGVVKIWNCHSRRGCVAELLKLCLVRMSVISSESDHHINGGLVLMFCVRTQFAW